MDVLIALYDWISLLIFLVLLFLPAALGFLYRAKGESAPKWLPLLLGVLPLGIFLIIRLVTLIESGLFFSESYVPPFAFIKGLFTPVYGTIFLVFHVELPFIVHFILDLPMAVVLLSFPFFVMWKKDKPMKFLPLLLFIPVIYIPIGYGHIWQVLFVHLPVFAAVILAGIWYWTRKPALANALWITSLVGIPFVLILSAWFSSIYGMPSLDNFFHFFFSTFWTDQWMVRVYFWNTCIPELLVLLSGLAGIGLAASVKKPSAPVPQPVKIQPQPAPVPQPMPAAAPAVHTVPENLPIAAEKADNTNQTTILQEGTELLQEAPDEEATSILPPADPTLFPLVCPACGTALPEDSEFCNMCGAAVPRKPVCRHCGAELPEGSAFCNICGKPVK